MKKPRTQPATKPEPSSAAAPATSEHETIDPDVSAELLATHAEKLANTIEAHLGALAKGKVTQGHADALRLGAKALRPAEVTWTNAWAALQTGTVAIERPEALRGRQDLFSALRTFADHDDATQRALDDIAGVDDDADLQEDLGRLLALATKHLADLEGTDVDAPRVAEISAAAERFKKARGGEGAGSGGSAQKRAAEARAAQRARNREFWALAALDREVCKRGRHVFRRDPHVLPLFSAYTSTTAARKPRPAPTAPAAPTA